MLFKDDPSGFRRAIEDFVDPLRQRSMDYDAKARTHRDKALGYRKAAELSFGDYWGHRNGGAPRPEDHENYREIMLFSSRELKLSEDYRRLAEAPWLAVPTDDSIK